MIFYPCPNLILSMLAKGAQVESTSTETVSLNVFMPCVKKQIPTTPRKVISYWLLPRLLIKDEYVVAVFSDLFVCFKWVKPRLLRENIYDNGFYQRCFSTTAVSFNIVFQ